MKQKCALGCALAVLLMCALSCGPVASAATTMTMEVGITFMEAESVYFFSFPEGGGMDINFGERRMPGQDGDLFIWAFDGSHTLRVCDTGVERGRRNIHVYMRYGGILQLLASVFADLQCGLHPHLLCQYELCAPRIVHAQGRRGPGGPPGRRL